MIRLDTILSGAILECEIIHTLSDKVYIKSIKPIEELILDSAVGHPGDQAFTLTLTTSEIIYQGSEFDTAIKFDSNQLDCELVLSETSEADNKFKLTVYNLPAAHIVTMGDVVKLKLYWTSDTLQAYYAECVVDTITNDISDINSKAVIDGTFLTDKMLRTTSMVEYANIIRLKDIGIYIKDTFGITLNTDALIDDYTWFYTTTDNKSITMLLNQFCLEYNTKYSKSTCTWYMFGPTLVIDDDTYKNIYYITVGIRSSDIISLAIVEETTTKKSIKLEVTGLTTIRKSSFISIDNSEVSSDRFSIYSNLSESYMVTEVEHKFGTSTGFYSTIYCYYVKEVEEDT